MKEDDLLIEVVRPASPGGQHVGCVNYPVRVTHIPTGLTVTCGWERSQHKNKKIALEMIEWGLVIMGLTDFM